MSPAVRGPISGVRAALGVATLAGAALALAAACDDGGGTDGSTGSGTSTGAGCADLAETCSASTDCCGPQFGCESSRCCITAGVPAAADVDCCTQQRDDGVCCVAVAADTSQRCKADADCCDDAWCRVGADGLGDCCMPAGSPSQGGLDCCSATANANGQCCSHTPGACAAPGCPETETRCATSADCCEGVCEHQTCCKFGGTPCTNDLECCSQTCSASGTCS